MQDQWAWHKELSVESWRCYFSAFSAGAIIDIDLCWKGMPDTSGPWVTDSKRDQITSPNGRRLLRSTQPASLGLPQRSDS